MLGASSVEIREQVPASRKLGAEDARNLLKGKKKLIVGKGSKRTEFALGKAVGDDVIAAMLGPTGNLRAPTLIVGGTVVVGFDAAAYAELAG